MVSVRFTASGYGTEVSRYPTRTAATRAVEEDMEQLAADRGLDPTRAVLRVPGEWVLSVESGEEIARWELL